MARWLWAGVLAGLMLAGCGEGSRVERRPLVLPEPKQAGSTAGAEPVEPSPHGMTLPKGHPPMEIASGQGAKPGEQPAATLEGPASREVKIDGLQLTAPKTWTRKPPRSQFIQAEFSLPRAEGDAQDGRLTVSQAGGTVKENVERWRKQFGDKPEKESQEKLEVAGLTVTLVDYSGAYQDQPGPFAPAVERPGYRMLGAIIEAGGQLYFVKAYGPAKTMAPRADEFRQFIRSLHRGGSGKGE